MTSQSFTCQGCGGQFTGRKRKYCTKQCRSRLYDYQKYRKQGRTLRSEITAKAACNQTHQCLWCGKAFQPNRAGRTKYCSRGCWFEFSSAKSNLVAGLSASHKVHRVKCGWCGCRFDSRNRKIYCSEKCSYFFHFTQARMKAEAEFVAVEFSCRECGKRVQTSYGQPKTSFCSYACRRRNHGRIRRKIERARLREVQVERVDPIKVFNRDGWRCQICGTKTQKAKRGKVHPKAPELDHIVPLSVGGEHSYRNTQCACRECNSKKGNAVYGQIPMFST